MYCVCLQRGTKDRPVLAKKQVLHTIPAVDLNERREALLYWVKIAQLSAYAKEIECCNKQKPLPNNSKIIKLTPRLDQASLLRVGGRISKANVPEDAKHQLILPPDALISRLIIRNAYAITVHGGAQLIMAHLRQKCWIPKMRQIANSVIHRCVQCIRLGQRPANQFMGDLPHNRVNEAKPFEFTGVDFASPFNIKRHPGRTSLRKRDGPETMVKIWVVVLVCMVTRAVHLDVVEGLCIKSFLGVFERFIMRKGRCLVLYSDNGTNFIGSDKELARVLKQWARNLPDHDLSRFGTKWKFISPASPHKGGLWEAAIRSMKMHLRRTIGNRTLTKDDLYQIAVQIEGCMNSRPLWPMSDKADDLLPLTPADFVLAKQILPQPIAEDVSDTPEWHHLDCGKKSCSSSGADGERNSSLISSSAQSG